MCEDRMQEDSCDKDVDNLPFLSKLSFNNSQNNNNCCKSAARKLECDVFINTKQYFNFSFIHRVELP